MTTPTTPDPQPHPDLRRLVPSDRMLRKRAFAELLRALLKKERR